MKDNDLTDTMDMSIQPVAELHPGHSDSWRSIPLWPSPTVDATPTQTPVQPTPEKRFATEMLARTTSIDPIHNPVTGAHFFAANEEAQTVNVSRHGLCLRCPRPPWVGARMLVKLLLSEDEPPVEFSGRVRWTRVDFIKGSHGARPVAIVGVHLFDGADRARARYERTLKGLAEADPNPVAAPKALG